MYCLTYLIILTVYKFTYATLVFEIRLLDFILYCWHLTIILVIFLAAAHSYLLYVYFILYHEKSPLISTSMVVVLF